MLFPSILSLGTFEGQDVMEENSKHGNIYNNTTSLMSLKHCLQFIVSLSVSPPPPSHQELY